MRKPSFRTASSPHSRRGPPRGKIAAAPEPAAAQGPATDRPTPPATGPPPPARGPPGGRLPDAPGHRNTPACAGTTPGSRRLRTTGPDHPRLRGDHNSKKSTRGSVLGTPPPARGPPGRPTRTATQLRNTPACAGTTAPSRAGSRCPAEHPRLRGDHRTSCWSTTASGEHPRLRGDHPSARRCSFPAAGTPPPARGPRTRRARPATPQRNTPACAGTTFLSLTTEQVDPEHPRLRGDHASDLLGGTFVIGTPPPARGPLRLTERVNGNFRNTPACAGTTRDGRPRRWNGAEHPRLRGDHCAQSGR